MVLDEHVQTGYTLIFGCNLLDNSNNSGICNIATWEVACRLSSAVLDRIDTRLQTGFCGRLMSGQPVELTAAFVSHQLW